MFSGCRLLMWFICVSRFSFYLYRLDRWFSCLNGFTLVLRPFIDWCSVWAKTSRWRSYFELYWFICDLNGELSHWHSYHILLYLFSRTKRETKDNHFKHSKWIITLTETSGPVFCNESDRDVYFKFQCTYKCVFCL